MAFVALASAAVLPGAGDSIQGIWGVTNSQLTQANGPATGGQPEFRDVCSGNSTRIRRLSGQGKSEGSGEAWRGRKRESGARGTALRSPVLALNKPSSAAAQAAWPAERAEIGSMACAILMGNGNE